MSLCLKDKDMSIGRLDTPVAPETPQAGVSTIPGMLPCAGTMNASSDTQEIPNPDQASRPGDGLTLGITDEITPALKCDGVPCHASCTAPIPSAAFTMEPGHRFSYAILFNSRFSSLVLEQLQRPPLV